MRLELCRSWKAESEAKLEEEERRLSLEFHKAVEEAATAIASEEMEDEALDKEVLSLIEKGEVGVPFEMGVGGEGTSVRHVVLAG